MAYNPQRAKRARPTPGPEFLMCCGTTCDPTIVKAEHVAQFAKGALEFAHYLAEHGQDVNELALQLEAFKQEQE